MWWDEERIGWYRRAAEETGFHMALADAIEPFLPKAGRILELGCGLGYVAEILSRRGHMITATDIDGNAIRNARKRTGLDIYSTLDAEAPLPDSDAIIMLFFGRLAEKKDAMRYLEHTGRIIYVISEHRGQSSRLRKSEGDPSRTMLSLDSEPRLKYTRYPFTADFDQPLASKEEAGRFISRMYGEERASAYMRYLRKDNEGYVLPNRKHASIFIIEHKGGTAI